MIPINLGSKAFKHEHLQTQIFQIPKRKISNYLTGYGAEFDENTLRKQRVKRKEITRWQYDQTSNPECLNEKNLIKGIKLSKNMLKLKIKLQRDFNQLESMNDWHCLFETLKRLRSLTDIFLSINLSKIPVILNHQDFLKVFKLLKKARYLQKIHIDFVYSSGITGPEIQFLLSPLKSLKSLKSLSFGLKKHLHIKDREFGAFRKYLKKLPALESVLLNFEGALRMDIQELLMLIQDLKKASSLKNLSINFARILHFRDNEVVDLLRTLDGFDSLQSLCLDFSGCRIMHSGIVSLLQYLKEKANLQHIGFRINLFEIPLSDIQVILENLVQLRSLKSLSVDFYGKDMIYQEIIQDLGRLPMLQTVFLDFRFFKGLKDSSLNSIFEELKGLDSLCYLTLVFPSEAAMIDQGLKEPIQCLRAMKSLKTLAFIFLEGCFHFDLSSISVHVQRDLPSVNFSASFIPRI